VPGGLIQVVALAASIVGVENVLDAVANPGAERSSYANCWTDTTAI
jgi:hypothetical protein